MVSFSLDLGSVCVCVCVCVCVLIRASALWGAHLLDAQFQGVSLWLCDWGEGWVKGEETIKHSEGVRH